MSNPIHSGYPKEEAERYDSKRFSDPWGKRFHQLELAQLLEALSDIPSDARVLEVGCGTGRFLDEIVEKKTDVVGVDLSKYMIREARNKVDESVNLIHSNGAFLPFHDDSFDFVYSIRALNQIPSNEIAESIIDEMVRIRKAEGMILIEFVNCKSLSRLASNSSTCFTPSQLKTRLRSHGLNIKWVSGVLFLSQTILELTPPSILDQFEKIDCFLTSTFPEWATRVYILAG